MPLVSIIVPAYRAEECIGYCLRSLECQVFNCIEIIVVNDASPDNTISVINEQMKLDKRIKIINLLFNCGTLGARKAGVLASTGDYVLLVDQDDELDHEAIRKLVEYATSHPADIYHFSARVLATGDAAARAREGMEGFLTPSARRIEGPDILRIQLLESGGFDWHVHHKMFDGDFARRCYSLASDERLVLSDDIYMSFILCSQAQSYEVVPNAPWYIYHLGRGETYGKVLNLEAYGRLAAADGKALLLARGYVESPASPARNDWGDRLDDLRDRLVFHAMNEWMDSLPDDLKDGGCDIALGHLPADAVCGELYRFVRDKAYALLQQRDRLSEEAKVLERETLHLLELARRAEAAPGFDESNGRYREMKDIACCHLRDCGLVVEEPADSVPTGLIHRLVRMIREAMGR
ncbi:glycosyltransferase family 2 protein [Thermophilibacter provencensis]|uniref:glycosyltransferase family 2 protein n=1 Tax=Thermophilibacter provencensis TaxID=1852386 RepID=UPI002943D330|nr:glycosyltransferase family 2 protein [Thermophilibacter provencensis]